MASRSRGPITATLVRALRKTKRHEQLEGAECRAHARATKWKLAEWSTPRLRWEITLAGELVIAAYDSGRRDAATEGATTP